MQDIKDYFKLGAVIPVDIETTSRLIRYITKDVITEYNSVLHENNRLLAYIRAIDVMQWSHRGQVDDYAFRVLEEIGNTCREAMENNYIAKGLF